MIIAEDVQDAMDQQLIKAPFLGHPSVGSLPCAGVHGNYHVSQQVGVDAPMFSFLHGKGDDIGGAVMAQVPFVKFLNARIIHDQYGEFALRAIQGV